MKMIAILILPILSFSCGTPRNHDDELRQSIQRFVDAYNRGDVETLADFYAEDAVYVSPHVEHLIIQGRGVIRDNWRKGIAGDGHIDNVEILTTGLSCDLAYVVTSYEATNAGVKASGRSVIVMKRVEGKWMTVTHASIVCD